MPSNPNISMSLQRALETLAEMKPLYSASLSAKRVDLRFTHLTHEVCERIRGILDRLCRAYWNKFVKQNLESADIDKSTIYFPISENMQSFRSTIGRWRLPNGDTRNEDIINFLLTKQPFNGSKNQWLKIVNELAIAIKHIDLEPQRHYEQRRITVTGRNGSVAWDPDSVRFSGGVSILGAAVDPSTQRIVAAPNVIEKVERWEGLTIPRFGVDPLMFCQMAINETSLLIEHFELGFDA